MFFSKKEEVINTNGVEKLAELPGLYGTYRGYKPTDESAISIGELEVVIDAEKVRISHATGSTVKVSEFKHDELRRISKDEIAVFYNPNSPIVDKIIGYQFGNNGLTYLFAPILNGSDALGLIIKGDEEADMLGITLAYGPKHIQSSMKLSIINKIFQRQGMPLIENGGMASESTNCLVM